MTKVYPLVALAAIVSGVAGMVFGQVGPDPYLDPLRATVGEYAVTGRGGVTGIATAVLALGSLALLAGLRAAGAPVRGAPERLLLVWSGALLVAAAVPATPLAGDVAAGIHWYVSMAAFVSLPAAGALLVSRLAGDEVWRPVARAVEWLALAGGLGVLAITYVALPGERVMIGLVERTLLGAEVAMLAVLSAWLLRVVWGRTAIKFTTYHRFIAS